MLRNYETLLFDLDDTLLDFRESERVSLLRVFSAFIPSGLGKDALELRDVYKGINAALWRAYENGEIERDYIFKTRFQRFFDELHVNASGEDAEKLYRAGLREGFHALDGASGVLDSLYRTHRLYVVSNGELTTQTNRLEKSGLIAYFSDVFISEAVGFHKPQPGFFEHVAKSVPGYDAAKTLIIGDSLSADIRGGQCAGIDTCWVNRFSLENDGLAATFEIATVNELLMVK